MAKSGLAIFDEIATRISDTAVPVGSRNFLPEEPLRNVVAADMHIDGHLTHVDITDSIIEKTRFTAANVADCSFDRIIFKECDLSGVTFVNCLFRHCLIVGAKSSSHLAFIDCNLDNLLIGQTRLEHLEFQNSKLGDVTLCDLRLRKLTFADCEKYKRRGQLTLNNIELNGATGLDTLHACGIQTRMDESLWRELSDMYMREKGFEALEPGTEISQLLDGLATLTVHG
jgi:hypothetical protein